MTFLRKAILDPNNRGKLFRIRSLDAGVIKSFCCGNTIAGSEKDCLSYDFVIETTDTFQCIHCKTTYPMIFFKQCICYFTIPLTI
jgi:hypothetical protein